MTARPLSLLATALLLGSLSLSAQAASSASSEASGSVSTSVGSLSDSIGKSSNSSSGGKDVAEGDYRVIEVAAAEAGAPVRVRLQATADASTTGELVLLLPAVAVARGELAAGRLVTAKRRAYGLEFAAGEQRQTFFLALSDDWYRELDSRPVTL